MSRNPGSFLNEVFPGRSPAGAGFSRPGAPGRPSVRLSRAGLTLGWLLALLTLLPHAALATQIQVTLDRNPVPVNESFTVTFTANEAPDGEPDFSPLRSDFEILNQGESNQVSIVDGRATRSMSWQLQLLAKAAGTLEIPAIAFGNDRSQPFAVTITHGPVHSRQGGGASIFLEVDAEPRNPYVQAQVILTLRVLSRVGFSGDLSQPDIPDAVVEKLDEDREYVTLRDGVQFKVDERRFAVFPQKSGRLTIGPVNLTAQLARPGGAGFGPFFRPSTRQQRLHSEPIDLDVRPIPAAFTGRHWLPATSVALSDSWLPATLRVPGGEPLTRTVTLKAEGATLGMLPELTGPDLKLAELRQYPDQPVTHEEKTANRILSQSQRKIALMATRPGRFTLPAMEIPWWNTATDRMEVARLPERTMNVLPSAQFPVPDTAPPQSAQAQAPDSSPAPAMLPQDGPDRWAWLALGLGLGWLLTMLAWWRSRRRPEHAPATATAAGSPRESALLRELERACRANDAFAARRTLESWAALHWPNSPPGCLGERFGGSLGAEYARLNRDLYGAGAGAWQGDTLWRQFKIQLADMKRKTGGQGASEALAGLYKS